MRLSPYSEETRRRAAAEALARKASGQRFFLRDVAAEVGVRPATIRNWVAQFGPGDDGVPTPPCARRESAFPLRGIAVCGMCSQAMIPAYGGAGPVYRCSARCRRRRPLSANALHTEASRAVLAAAPDFARGDRPVVHALARVVSRITVGSTPSELMLRWRPAGVDRRARLAMNAGGRRLDHEPGSAAWPTA